MGRTGITAQAAEEATERHVSRAGILTQGLDSKGRAKTSLGEGSFGQDILDFTVVLTAAT